MQDFIINEDFPKSEIEFDLRFSDPSRCFDYLFSLKWPTGFVCKKCKNNNYWISKRQLYICTVCEHQHSLTAGTIMDSSKKPITYWFKAMWWFTTRKSGVNAVNLQELLGFGSYDTAWHWLQKLRRCKIRKECEKLSGRVEVDEFVIGGQRSGKRGRGAEAKTIVVAAVERCDQKKQIGRIRLQVILDILPIHWKPSLLKISNQAAMSLQTPGPATHLFSKNNTIMCRQTNQKSVKSLTVYIVFTWLPLLSSD
jgi:hypothetical protein